MKTTKNKSKNTDSELIGYPKYAPEADIMNQAERVDVDLSDDTQADKPTKKNPVRISETEDNEMPEGIEDDLKPTSESDVTEEDIQALGPKDLSMDMGDDEQLKHRTRRVDFSGDDLDIPGADLDNESEEIGSEDEENNGYSLGGEDHQDLEEPRP
jgi:hypothetical protein